VQSFRLSAEEEKNLVKVQIFCFDNFMSLARTALWQIITSGRFSHSKSHTHTHTHIHEHTHTRMHYIHMNTPNVTHTCVSVLM